MPLAECRSGSVSWPTGEVEPCRDTLLHQRCRTTSVSGIPGSQTAMIQCGRPVKVETFLVWAIGSQRSGLAVLWPALSARPPATTTIAAATPPVHMLHTHPRVHPSQVQLLKFALNMPPHSRVITGSRRFADIDLGETSKPLLAKARRGKRAASVGQRRSWGAKLAGKTAGAT